MADEDKKVQVQPISLEDIAKLIENRRKLNAQFPDIKSKPEGNSFKSHAKNRKMPVIKREAEAQNIGQTAYQGKFDVEGDKNRKGRRHSADFSIEELENPQAEKASEVKFRTARKESVVNQAEQDMMQNAERYLEGMFREETAVTVTRLPDGEFRAVIIEPPQENESNTTESKDDRKASITKQQISREVVEDFAQRRVALDAAQRYIARISGVESQQVEIDHKADPFKIKIYHEDKVRVLVETEQNAETIMEWGAIQQVVEKAEGVLQVQTGQQVTITPQEQNTFQIAVHAPEADLIQEKVALSELVAVVKQNHQAQRQAPTQQNNKTTHRIAPLTSSYSQHQNENKGFFTQALEVKESEAPHSDKSQKNRGHR